MVIWILSFVVVIETLLLIRVLVVTDRHIQAMKRRGYNWRYD